MGRLMVKVFIIGLMGNPIKDNSLKEWSRATVSGMEQNRIHILERGNRIKQMGMVCMYGWMATDMKDHGRPA
jgi:hypothetical protein